jgi:mannosyltransferase
MKTRPLSICSDNPRLMLLLIAIFGATLRIYALGERSLLLDEALSARLASQSIWEIITNTTDPHPLLYDMILHTWVSFFGDSEQALRSLSVIFGSVAIVLLGLLGFLLYDRRTGLFAGLFMAVMVFPLHYAQEARGYSLFLVMTLGSFYLCLQCLRGGGKADWLGYLLFTIGLSYTHNYWVFLVLAQNLYVLLFYRAEKPVLVRWTGIQLGVVLCFLPWLIPLLKQTGRVMQEGFWISQPGISNLKNTLQGYFALVDHHLVLWGYICLCALGVVQLRSVRGVWRWKALRQSLESYRWEMYLDNVQRSGFLLLWFICPFLVPFLLSQVLTPFFQIPLDFVVDSWASSVESRSILDFLCIHYA